MALGIMVTGKGLFHFDVRIASAEDVLMGGVDSGELVSRDVWYSTSEACPCGHCGWSWNVTRCDAREKMFVCLGVSQETREGAGLAVDSECMR